MKDGATGRDFFISFNKADLAFAEALDRCLRAKGFTTFYYPRDLMPGSNIASWMDDALINSRQTIAVISPDYMKDDAQYSKAERYASWWDDPSGVKRKLIPILIREADLTPLLSMVSRIEVVGLDPESAAAKAVEFLCTAGEAEHRRSAQYDSARTKLFRVAYLPNPNFAGRFEELEALHSSLKGENDLRIIAITGMPGVGKTTLAAEYCHRFCEQYEGVWWIRADQELTIALDLQVLGLKVGCASNDSLEKDALATLEYLAGRNRPWLLVYDNAPSFDDVREWLPCGQVRCVITSRFTEFGEIARLAPLELWPDQVTTNYLLARTDRRDSKGANYLATSLGGLPLAAEQAGSYLRLRAGVSFTEYANEIERLIREPKPAGAQGSYPDTVYAAFVKSIESVRDAQSGGIAIELLCFCAFLNPDDIDPELLDWATNAIRMNFPFSAPGRDKLVREDAFAVLVSLSLLRRVDYGVSSLKSEDFGPTLVFHRLLLQVVRDWMGVEARSRWGSAALNIVNSLFPAKIVNDPSLWLYAAHLMMHVKSLEQHAPRTGIDGCALDRLLGLAAFFTAAQGNEDEALNLAERGVSLMRQTRKDEPKELAVALSNLAIRYGNLERFDEAEAAYLEALDLLKVAGSGYEENKNLTVSGLGVLYSDRGKFAQAEPLMLRVLEDFAARYGKTSAQYGIALHNLGSLYDRWGEATHDIALQRKGLECSSEAMAVTRSARGPRHFDTALRHTRLGIQKARQSDWAGASLEFERGLAIRFSLHLADHPDMRDAVEDLIFVWKRAGRMDRAARLSTGEITDLVPVILDIESQQRSWVAEAPEIRDFGPPSFDFELQGD